MKSYQHYGIIVICCASFVVKMVSEQFWGLYSIGESIPVRLSKLKSVYGCTSGSARKNMHIQSKPLLVFLWYSHI